MASEHRGPMRKGIRPQGKKSFEIKIDLPRGPDGKRRSRYVAFKGTRREAELHRATLIADAARGVLADPQKMTVKQQIQSWLKGPAQMNASPKTFERWEDICEKRLIPAFGNTRLRNLTAAQIEEQFIGELMNGRVDGNGGLAYQTVVAHRAVLSMAIGAAVPALLPRNVVADAKLPKRDAAGMKNDFGSLEKQRRALSDNERGALMHAIEGTSVYAPAMLALTTGMRRGEVLGLRWEDVEIDNKRLFVKTALEQTRKGGIRMKAPKTKGSRREIALATLTVDLLREQQGDQLKDRLKLGIGGRPEMVFTNTLGETLNPHSFTKKFLRITREIGCTFHTLRHTHASDLLRNGVPITTVSRRLGHTRVSTTLDVYSHMMPSDQEQAVDAIEAIFG